jgi:hypothetical protein
MRWHLRASSVVLISLLSLSQAAIVYCEATCGTGRGNPAAVPSESTCHSSTTQDADLPQIEAVQFGSCDHDLPTDVIVAAQRDSVLLREAGVEPGERAWTPHVDRQALTHRHPDPRPDRLASAAIQPPLRI